MGAGRFYEIVTDSEGNFEITEIDRILKELETCKDIQKCLNIIHDLDEVLKENGTELIREKGIEAVIEYGSESLSNGSEMMFDGMVGMAIEKIKNEKTGIREKKNIIILLDNIISNGIEVKEESEILRIASNLEEEGRRMIKKRGISKEEKKEWKELSRAALSLEATIMDKRKGKEENKSMLNLIEENENEKKEKEEEHKRAEKALKEKEEADKKIEEIKKELEEIKRNKEQSISLPTAFLSSLTIPFDSLPLSFSDSTKMKREGNKIIHIGPNSRES